ncbi:MAG: hypothetical protein Q8934_23150 [Bacillota bacterium]|nr:hypothetical protein [Bacillota bacterium]
MKKVGLDLILFFISFFLLRNSYAHQSHYFWIIIVLIITLLGLMKYKNESHSAILVMAAISAILALANNKLISPSTPAMFIKVLNIFNLLVVAGVGIVSFLYIHVHSQKEKKRKFRPKEQQDMTEKISHFFTTSKKVIKLWKTRKESNISFLKQLESLFEKKVEEKNAVDFILGTEVDQDFDSYKYE